MLIGVVIFFTQPVCAQSLLKRFKQVSRPEKVWVLAHPFVAKRAWQCAQRAREATDSLEQTNTLRDGNGGQLDAFRHAYWMCLLAETIGSKRALKLGHAHERGNYLDFIKGKNEDGTLPDSVSSVMDERNNAVGAALGDSIKHHADSSLTSLQVVVYAVMNGSLWIIRKDAQGHALTCAGDRVAVDERKKVWGKPKCLVASDDVH